MPTIWNAADLLCYNVIDGGAVGNGTTDDSAAIQALINTAAGQTNGATVIFTAPSVAYRLSNGVTVPSNVSAVFFEGASLSIDAGQVFVCAGTLSAPLAPIFSGYGTVSLTSSGLNNVYPQWWGAKGDSSTDNTAAFADMIAAVSVGSQVHIPSGVYKHAGIVSTKRLTISGEGTGTVLYNTNTSGGHNLYIDGSASLGSGVRGMIVRDLVLSGPTGSGDGLRLKWLQNGYVSGVHITGAGATGLNCIGVMLSTFVNVSASVNDPNYGALSQGVMTRGIMVDGLTTYPSSNGNSFIGCHAEGIVSSPGIGIDLYKGQANVFSSCVSEGNTVGLNIGQVGGLEPARNTFLSLYMEANGTEVVGADLFSNTWIGSDIPGSPHNYMQYLSVQTNVGLGNAPPVTGLLGLTNNQPIMGITTGSVDRSLVNLSSSNVMELGDANLDAHLTGSKLAFYPGVSPISRAVLATGAGHVVDDVITALQNLGLVKQS